MEFNMLIVIACVLTCISLLSMLLINKYFRGKTFEEVAAEKKLLAEKLYGASKQKKQARKLPNKKINKDRKSKQKATESGNKDTEVESQNDSDAQSDSQSTESTPLHQKQSVEIHEPAIVNESDVAVHKKNTTKQNKRKNSGNKVQNSPPVSTNRSESCTDLSVETITLVEQKSSKDAEIKKQPKDEVIDSGKGKLNTVKKSKEVKEIKEPKVAKKEEEIIENIGSHQTEPVIIKKDSKPAVEKSIKSTTDTPKPQPTKSNKKKKNENSGPDSVENTEVTNVKQLIRVLGQAELTKNEIQILIDFLLNKQQDTIVNHSEWSDDIVQKLRKQLAEKENALQELQEASAGIQAKLRELRLEVNSEKIQYNANVKALQEELEKKNTEIALLLKDQKIVAQKIIDERQKFQTKFQEFSVQIQQLNERINFLQSELVQKNTIINELEMFAKSSQADEETNKTLNETIQNQQHQLMALEKSLKEVELKNSRQAHELMATTHDNSNSKVEIRNLQNDLESVKTERAIIMKEIVSLRQHSENVTTQNNDLTIKLAQISNENSELLKQTNELRAQINLQENAVKEKEEQLLSYDVKIKALTNKEDELMKQILEQKQKNDEIRVKNWKLVEALQKAETVKSNAKNINNLALHIEPTKVQLDEQNQNRANLDRKVVHHLFTANEGGYNQQVGKHDMQYANISNRLDEQISKKSIGNSQNYSNNHKDETTNNNHNAMVNSSDECINNSNISSSNSASNFDNDGNLHETNVENAQLKAQITQLTSIITKTENTLRHLETQAIDQEAYWRGVVRSMEEEIGVLRNSKEQAT